MKRLYYLAPTIESVEKVSEDLHQKGITDWRFHVVSRNEAGLSTHRIHSANILYRSDLVRFVERGAIIGGFSAACIVLPLATSSQLNLGAGLLLTIAVMCTIAGAWIGGFGGISSENYKIRRFHKQIETGSYLLMIDVKKDDVEAMELSMEKQHPEAELQGVGSTTTNPFVEADGKFHII